MKVNAPLLASSKPSDDSQDTDNNHYNLRVSLNNMYGVPKERRKTKCDCNKDLSKEKKQRCSLMKHSLKSTRVKEAKVLLLIGKE